MVLIAIFHGLFDRQDEVVRMTLEGEIVDIYFPVVLQLD